MRAAVLALMIGMLLAVAAPPTAHAQAMSAAPKCSLLVDASGSMEGYAAASEPTLIRFIDSLRRLCTDAYLFGDTAPNGVALRSLPPSVPIHFGDSETNIGPALEQWSAAAPNGAFLVMITDNVADDGQDEDANTRFYDFLRGDNSPISNIVVLAFRAPFSGKLYAPNKLTPPAFYSGPRALTVYLLAKNASGREADFSALRGTLVRLLEESGRSAQGGVDQDYTSYAAFDIKPFATETFHVESRRASLEAASQGGESSCSAEARVDEQTKRFELVDQPMGESCKLNAELTVRFPNRWCLQKTDLHAELKLNAADHAILEQAVTPLAVDPPKADLCRADQTLKIGLAFNAFQFKNNVSFWDKVRRALTGTFSADGTLTVVGSVLRQNVGFQSDVTDAWSLDNSSVSAVVTPDTNLQRKVFRLSDVVRAAIPETQLERHELASFPVKVTVRYSPWPFLLVLLLAALVIAALVIFLMMLGKPRLYEVETENGVDERVQLGMFAQYEVAAGDLRLRLTNLVVLLLASSNGRISRGRVLGLGGGQVVVEGRGVSGRRAPRRPGRRTARSTDEDEFDDDEDFDGGSWSTPTGGSAVFTVRDIKAGSARPGDHHDDDEF